MRKVSSILVVVALLAIPLNLCAKRVAPQPVNPVVSGNIKYSAHGDGRTGYVVATEVATGKELWRAKIFHIQVKPWIEEDNQWIFISDLTLLDNALLVRDERLRCYRVDLATKHVKKSYCP
jgi:hypothetical protein